jgi:hypothetical protein
LDLRFFFVFVVLVVFVVVPVVVLVAVVVVVVDEVGGTVLLVILVVVVIKKFDVTACSSSVFAMGVTTKKYLCKTTISTNIPMGIMKQSICLNFHFP